MKTFLPIRTGTAALPAHIYQELPTHVFYIILYTLIFYLHSFDIYSLFVSDEIVSHIFLTSGINLTFIGKRVFV